MKQFALCVLAAGLLTGCAHHYDMVLTNGQRITNVTKPKLDRGNSVYVYKDVAGNERFIPTGRVIEIKPYSHKDDTYFTGK